MNLNCQPGDVAYISRNIPTREEDSSLQGILLRAMRGRTVTVTMLKPDMKWRIEAPVVFSFAEGDKTGSAEIDGINDMHLMPIAGPSRLVGVSEE
jgi:hypothetical protein